jgi:hypothetical protein
MIKWAVYKASMRDMGNEYRTSVEKPEGKRLLVILGPYYV